MSQRSQPAELPSAVLDVLAMLRRRVRAYVWVQGLAWLVASLGAIFWISLLGDWFFEPSAVMRGLLLAAAVLALGWVSIEKIVRRAFARLPDRGMAMLLERYFPRFGESLITAVELAGKTHRSDHCNPEMLRRTCHLAAEPLDEVRLGKIFNLGPLWRGVLLALLLTTTIVAFGIRCPEALGVWTRRSLLLADEPWPRQARLMVEGFEDGAIKVARGADLTIIAKADATMPLVPAVVKIRYRVANGSRHQETMTREGTIDPVRDPFQKYAYTFQGVLAPIQFDVVGGDDAVRDLRVEVVDSPTLLEMVLDGRFPAYMGRSPRTLPVAGTVPIPVGTNVVLRATANKDLARMRVERVGQETSPSSTGVDTNIDIDIDWKSVDSTNPRNLIHVLGTLVEDQTLLFSLEDTDGITSREPIRLTLMAVADEPPEVAVGLHGIGTAVTPRVRLPALGQITDDHGLGPIWFEHAVNAEEPVRIPIASPSGNPTELPLEAVLDARPLHLAPGQQWLVSVKAADRHDLDERPNEGTSERWLLDVVTAEQLRTMLESRELMLRERFEAILAEVTDTRELLATMEFDHPSPARSENPVSAGNEDEDEAGNEDEGESLKTSAAESDEKKSSSQRMLGLRTLRVQRAMQNSRKDAHEILGVTLAFEGIREELINNRIDTEELKARLQGAVADPLRQVADRMYPELQRRLDELLEVLADEDAAVEHRDRAVAQLDTILTAMHAVLARMIELEDFNEAITLLREIIEAQESLNQQTKQKHKDKLRN